ncbi:MAG: AMP-binding protein [Succinivibrionaceae bacterium]|nr:AMP-binding protein [Succinivibrionaceae bacterium]
MINDGDGTGSLKLEYSSLAELFDDILKKYAQNPMLRSFGVCYTYEQIDELSRNFANYLLHSLHMQKGERIALIMPNLIQMPIAIIGALRAGMVVVNVNPQYTSREIHYQILDSGASTIVILENFADRLSEIIDYTLIKTVIVTKLGDMFANPKRFIFNLINRYFYHGCPEYKFLAKTVTFHHALRHGSRVDYEPQNISLDDLAFLQYTGGTTGRPKGALLSNRNLLSNLEQIELLYGNVIHRGKERIMAALPLYHVFALTVNFLFMSKIGGYIDLITDPRKINVLVKELISFRPTAITGVNTLFNALTFNDEFANKGRNNDLHLVVGGGMAIQRSVAQRWKKITGTYIIEGYGLTECSPLVAVVSADEGEYTGSIGNPVPFTRVKIMDEHDQEITGCDREGELWVKGPQVTSGYWKREDDTRNAISDGWFKTGDIVIRLPNNQLKIVDRKKDMILVSGFNVFPNEIEEVVATHYKVKEVAAIGVKSSNSGEQVKIFVVKKDPSLTQEEIIAHCYKYLAHYKVPKKVEFMHDLPKSNVGKILRMELRKLENERRQ